MGELMSMTKSEFFRVLKKGFDIEWEHAETVHGDLITVTSDGVRL